jgi:hypothetical protein
MHSFGILGSGENEDDDDDSDGVSEEEVPPAPMFRLLELICAFMFRTESRGCKLEGSLSGTDGDFMRLSGLSESMSVMGIWQSFTTNKPCEEKRRAKNEQ